MDKYDYLKAVKDDVRDFIDQEWETSQEISQRFTDREELEENLNEILWVEDGVTGNASGSYTFSTYQAEENLCHNLDLLQEAMDEFGYEGIGWINSPETCDVLIRSYLLPRAIEEVLDEIEENIFA